jgi:hypothetical protein
MRGTDVATLARLVNLPFPPVAVRWETSERPGGNDWSLAALITLTPAQVAELARSARAAAPQEAVMATKHLTQWFPRASEARARASGEKFTRVRATVTDGASFHKSPLIHGQALLFEPEGLVYLSLFTM